jgi:hypothetical protein
VAYTIEVIKKIESRKTEDMFQVNNTIGDYKALELPSTGKFDISLKIDGIDVEAAKINYVRKTITDFNCNGRTTCNRY